MSEHLPTENADGQPFVPLTEEQRYIFDTKGWLLFPSLISEDELKPMREFYLRLKDDPDSLPEHERSTIAGPLLPSIDHPVMVGFLHEFMTTPSLSGEKCYGFRLESSAMYYRPPGFDAFRPHAKLVESMHPLRQTLFRGVHCERNLIDDERSYPPRKRL